MAQILLLSLIYPELHSVVKSEKMKMEKYNTGDVFGTKGWERQWASEGTQRAWLLKARGTQASHHLHGFQPEDRKHAVISTSISQPCLPLRRLNSPLSPSELIVHCSVYCNISVEGNHGQWAPLHFLWLQLPSTPFSHESCTCRALLSGMARVWRLRQLPLCHVLLQSPQILTDEIQSICNPLKPIRSNSLWTRPPHCAGVALPPRFVPEHLGERRRARALTHTSTFSFSLLLAFPQCEKRVWQNGKHCWEYIFTPKQHSKG